MAANGIVVVIPARLASSRLPRKVLADIAGRPMLWHVYRRCLKADGVDAVHVATDSEEVAEHVRSWGGQAWMTDPDLPSGTARIAAIAPQLDADIIVNVQGDEPLLDPALVSLVARALAMGNAPPDIATPVFPLSWADALNPNLVKVVLRHDGYALYFSRQAIPHLRDIAPEERAHDGIFWGHIGVYGYRRQTLLDFPALPRSPLEDAEKLEQLRFLQAGKQILTVPTTYIPTPVDVASDLERARVLMAKELRTA